MLVDLNELVACVILPDIQLSTVRVLSNALFVDLYMDNGVAGQQFSLSVMEYCISFAGWYPGLPAGAGLVGTPLCCTSSLWS